ncbi:MAG: hypothetical protein ABIG69_18455 [Bacteroidota bacterium]
MDLKKKTIIVLIVLSALLLISNIITELLKSSDEDDKIEISAKQIENNFLKITELYGIDVAWIQIKKISSKNNDSLKHIYSAKIPTDVTIPSMIKDFSTLFADPSVEIETYERSINGNNLLRVSVNEERKFEAHLNYDKNINREFARIGFIIKNAPIDLNSIINFKNLFPADFALLLTPSDESKNIINPLKKNKIKYLIDLSDKISSAAFEIEEGDSKFKLQRAVVAIISVFGRDAIYFFNSSSELYNSVIFNYVRDEFRKRKVKLKNHSLLTNLSGERDDLISLFKFYVKSGISNQPKLLLIDYEDAIVLKKEISAVKKAGHKFGIAENYVE